MAALNEAVWRNTNWDFWVGFKLIGVPGSLASSISGLSWFGVDVTFSAPDESLITQAQPEPNWPAPLVLNAPDGWVEPFGPMIFQKKSWFQKPPPLLRISGGSDEIMPRISSIVLPSSFGSAATPSFSLLV
ncbi:hypothetical protein WR25_00108 [Diploscapter pachys]|uniref:Uncharacterized protein n=1 Tax=Diploscapter pachys TaxID=2018661 RepID=A0A2A2M327_9BILA|nr:hypothetical protein WR25_00108 [Diploscapter pachys]